MVESSFYTSITLCFTFTKYIGWFQKQPQCEINEYMGVVQIGVGGVHAWNSDVRKTKKQILRFQNISGHVVLTALG